MKKAIIVGAGPVGLTMSHFLNKIDISNVVLEQHPELSVHPSAHFLHPRSMEIFRDIDLHEQIYNLQPPVDDWRNYIYCGSLTGQVYRKYDHFTTIEHQKSRQYTDLEPAHFSQHKLTKLLLNTLESEVLFNHHVTKVEQGKSGVRVWVNGQKSIEGDVILACDGAHSTVSHLLGIKYFTQGAVQNFFSIHLHSKQISDLVRKNPAMLYFIYNKNEVGVLVNHSIQDNEFVLQYPIFPDVFSIDEFTDQKIKQVLSNLVGENIDDYRIESVKQWRMQCSRAEKLRKDRIFLIGDAAHRVTPAGGFGLNLGLQDVQNLYWKLRDQSLWDSYEQERLPHIDKTVKLSQENYLKSVEIAKCFNLDLQNAMLLEKVSKALPFGKKFFQFGMSMSQYVFDDTNARDFLSVDHNCLSLFFPQLDMNFKYKTGYFTSKGGFLAPHQSIKFQQEDIYIRELPKKLQFKMLYIKGKQDLCVKDNTIETIQVDSEHSFVIRPDGIVFDSS